MADLTNILGGPWSPEPERRLKSAEEQLRDAIIAEGLAPPDKIIMDGQFHRFASGTRRSGYDKAGWYVAYPDSIPSGRFGCWRIGLDVTWQADMGRRPTPAEQAAHAIRVAEAKALRDAELAKAREAISSAADAIWDNAAPAPADHPYLVRKGIQPHGAKITGDGRLITPLYDRDGQLATLQYIAADGGKLYHPGGQTGGRYWVIGPLGAPGTLYVAEGFATAASVAEATSRPCAVAYSANNLGPVVGSLRERYGVAQEICIVADNDESGVGLKSANEAADQHGARVIMPPIVGMDANDYAQAGHDLGALLMGLRRDPWLIPADDFSAQPAPIAWLVRRWLQDQALIMVHGPSGGGKTFVVLDWCLSMASGLPDWCGHKVKPGNVVYLAGEGHHGLRGRIAAWKHHNAAGHLTMWLSQGGCDLNTPQGYQQVASELRTLAEIPRVIVVDTLHRFLAGDENSAQDTKTMLDACAALMTEFGCSVILVHHTGVAEEAQHRARGSSAWRGALDIEISVVPGKNGEPMQIIQRKSKDAELAQPVYVELQSVSIPGWVDEDGEPVTSAVVVESVAPTPKGVSKIAEHRRTFERAWFDSGCEKRKQLPYVSKSAFKDFLIKNQDNKIRSEASANQYIKPSSKGKPISELLEAGIIEEFEHGWIVIDTKIADDMMRVSTA